MINIPAMPQLTGDSDRDIRIVYEYVVKLVQTLTEAPGFGADVSAIQDSVTAESFDAMFFEPEPSFEALVTVGLQGVAGAQGSSGPPGLFDIEEAEVQIPPPGERGAVGATGATGATGVQGVQGIPGPPGFDGIDADEVGYIIFGAVSTII